MERAREVDERGLKRPAEVGGDDFQHQAQADAQFERESARSGTTPAAEFPKAVVQLGHSCRSPWK